jgi:penicillin-binding protein 1A
MYLFLQLFRSGFVLLIFFVTYVFLHYASLLPSYEALKDYHPAQITRIYSSDLRLIEEYGMEKRVFIPISSVPAVVKNAFIAAEDKNFYSHNGIDFKSTIQATLYAVPRIWNKKTVKGGSTITQQVVKNLLLSSEKTVERKIKELILAAVISKKLSKDQILELYLNQVYFGLGVYGIVAAARYYFDQSVENLTIPEVAFLSGLLSSPVNCHPRTNYKRAKVRRDYSLYRMYENGFITKQQMKEALISEIVMKKRDTTNGLQAPHYAEKVRELAIQKVGANLFYSGGLTIVTTLNSQHQEWAEKSFIEGLHKYDAGNGYRGPLGQISMDNWKDNLNKFSESITLKENMAVAVITSTSPQYLIGLKNGEVLPLSCKGSFRNVLQPEHKSKQLKSGDVVVVLKESNQYYLSQIPECDGAIFVMQPASGKVLSMVGGYNYESSKFDRATQAKRQVGSTIKTFVYLAALESSIEPNTIFEDEPIEVFQGPNLPPWSPRNHDGKFLGPITMRAAFEKSRNTVTVNIAKLAGLGRITNLLKRLGYDLGDNQYLSIVLGAVEATLSQVVSSYSAVVNGGHLVKPVFIEYIQDSKGRILYKNDLSSQMPSIQDGSPPIFTSNTGTRVLDEASSYQLVSMMIGAAKRGTAKAFGQNFRHVVGGKTGTTNEGRDVWFVGFSNDLVVGSYVGHDMPKSLGPNAFGSTVALPIVSAFMTKALQNKPVIQFKIPKNIELKKIDINSGVVTESNESSLIEAFKLRGSAIDVQTIENEAPKVEKTDEENNLQNKEEDSEIMEEDMDMIDLED